MMREVCAPLYMMLRRWLFEGELHDPFQEFFVTDQIQNGGGGGEVWYEKYSLRLVRNFSLLCTILFSRFDRPLTLIYVF